ncbi:DUF4129 domain-containing protein [Actinopolymorpha alba]|uniref:DUF4129 domain-containing protein n=1 Tax=Actinopolymorpha alba TaxID=533267 RepID=UPI00036E8C6D|nr:DUF4129 domain-containing protein [Actinopolymorpha alba]
MSVPASLAAVGAVPELLIPPLRPSSEPPIDISREEAARAARDELTKGIYHRDEPGVVSRFLTWAFEQMQRFMAWVADYSPGGFWGLLGLLAILVLAVVIIRWRIGALARSRARVDVAVFAGQSRTAAEHRAAADEALRQGDYDAAVRERFRALVRDLEERTLLDERPGRTADEVAREAAQVAPGSTEPLRAAAQAFDEVCYGGRRATPEAEAVVRAADDAVRQLRRPALLAAGNPS